MALNRYYEKNGQQYSLAPVIYQAVKDNQIDFEVKISSLGERLDHIAYSRYNNAHYWWVIAAASGIGWWLQMPADIVLYIPTNIEQVSRLKDNV